MGRTRRRRCKKATIEHLDHVPELIELRKWLSKKGWKNEANLKLINFPVTGRGVMALRDFQKNDTLITMPLDVMITYSTLHTSLQEVLSLSSGKLEMHDLLTIFLITEKRKENSLWREYINSLPQEPPPLPWLGTAEELNLYPADLQIISWKKRKNLKESMYRAMRSIKKHCDCVLDENLFKWGYVLVNTRAVYIHPDVARNMNQCFLDDVLADEPKMALCPFLDMFNHDFQASCDVRVTSKEGRLYYELKTCSNTNKYDEIFISYGSHDNIKLLMEYGFYIPGNILDTVEFDLQEVLNFIQLNGRQYKFIKEHNLDEGLSIGYDGLSFNLKAVLFVGFKEEFRNYTSVIYGSYPEDFLEELPKLVDELLRNKAEVYKENYEKLARSNLEKSSHGLLMEDFLRYRMSLPGVFRKKLYQVDGDCDASDIPK